jgi:hypothetical protein
MESLKPLKIIGALASLCLAIFLAIPDGRLNTMAGLRSLGFPKYTDQTMYQGKYKEFLTSGSNLEILIGNRDRNQLDRRLKHLDIALKSHDPILLGIASRNATLNLSPASRTPVELQQISELMSKMDDVNAAGQVLVPTNAFFPLQRASIARFRNQDDRVRTFIYQAAECTEYTEYAWQEPKIRLESLAFQPSKFEESSDLAAVMFPNLAPHKTIIRDLIGVKNPSQNLDDRIAAIKVGRLMTTSPEVIITQLVGKSIINIGVSINPPETTKSVRIGEKDWKAVVTEADPSHRTLLENAYRFSGQPTSLPDNYYDSDWNLLYQYGPLVSKLPVAIFLVFTSMTCLILVCQKVADKPWVKPIRYLALVPLSLALAQNSTSFDFHLPTVITILVVSFPIALITFTEKFVPVIHLTIVGISVYFFEKETVLSEVLIHVLIMSALVLLTWHKNRKPEASFSKFLSIALIFANLGILILWIPVSLNEISGVASLPLVLICLALSSLAIVDSDRQLARRQAIVVASLGLATFAATAFFSLKVTNKLANSTNDETLFGPAQALINRDVFPSTTESNNPDQPDVKLKDK